MGHVPGVVLGPVDTAGEASADSPDLIAREGLIRPVNSMPAGE